jgi:hypothetical protein
MKITAQTSICHHIPGMVREYLNEGITRFEQVVRQQQALTEHPRAFHRVRIDLEPDEQFAYDYAGGGRFRHRPRYIELKWTWGRRHRWELSSVSVMGSNVLKTGRLGKHRAVSLILLGQAPLRGVAGPCRPPGAISPARQGAHTPGAARPKRRSTRPAGHPTDQPRRPRPDPP